MTHSNAILHQIASFIPRHDFEKLAQQYHGGQKFRSFNRWTRFMAMTVAQFTFRQITYRDPETGKVYRFLTNSKKFKASEIAALYKER